MFTLLLRWHVAAISNIAFHGIKRPVHVNDDDDEIAYFTVRWKTRASFVYRTKNMR